jgi:hydrogenase-4 component B
MPTLFAAAAALILGTLAAALVPGNRRRAWVSIGSQALATVLVLRAAIPVLFGAPPLEWAEPMGEPIGLLVVRLDALGAFFLVWSLPLTLLGSVYALGYLAADLDQDERHVGLHFALLNLTALAFVVVYTLENGLVFFFGWELAALAAWLLVIWDYSSQKIRFAGFNYLVSTHLSLLFLVAAFMLMHAEAGSFGYDAFAGVLSTPGPVRDVAFVLLTASFALKSAFFPFHTWLPRAHAAAPAHVSALMSGVIHKAGLFAMLRFALLMERPEAWMGWFVLAFSAVSAVMGVLYTTSQRDLKRLLGYSSTENVGLCGIGFGLALLGRAWDAPGLVALGLTGGILHVLNHALFKCLLFYGAGAVYRQAHTVDIERLGGLVKTMPRTAALFLVGALAICGLPPLNGFVSELSLYAGLLGPGAPSSPERAGLIGCAAVVAFVGAMSALAMVRAFGIAFLGAPRDPRCVSAGEPRAPMQLAMGLHAAACIAVGLFPAAGLALVAAPVQLFLDRLGRGADVAALLELPRRVLLPLGTLGLALVATVAALALLRRLLVPAAAPHVTWGCGYTAPTPRMQYTAASFSAQLVGLVSGLLPHLRREKLPPREQVFPQHTGYLLERHSVDAVEHRLFEVLDAGQASAERLSAQYPDGSRLSFAFGLVLLILSVAAIVGGAR